MATPDVSDYTGYDYKQEYWQQVNRQYEHQVESLTLNQLLRQFPVFERLLDAGCGFGRLFPAYAERARSFILMDYSADLLAQAKSDIQSSVVTYVQGNLYEIPLPDRSVDAVVTIRTLHHFQKPESLISQFHRVLLPGGILIMEIPNKRHWINILRFVFGNRNDNPFSKAPLVHSKTFLNFHPDFIFSLLKESGFDILHVRSTSFFRSPLLKKFIPTTLLVRLDLIIQHVFCRPLLTPSIFVVAKRR